MKKKVSEKHHYTCLTSETSCDEIYYIYYVSSSGFIRYIRISNRDTIESVIKKELSDVDNKNNSALKDVIDNWYSAKLIDYTSKLEDTVWCNDRSMDNIKGLDKNAIANSSEIASTSYNASGTLYVRPSISLKSGTMINGGDGSYDKPYIIN